jgi:hypothetical protein
MDQKRLENASSERNRGTEVAAWAERWTCRQTGRQSSQESERITSPRWIRHRGSMARSEEAVLFVGCDSPYCRIAVNRGASWPIGATRPAGPTQTGRAGGQEWARLAYARLKAQNRRLTRQLPAEGDRFHSTGRRSRDYEKFEEASLRSGSSNWGCSKWSGVVVYHRRRHRLDRVVLSCLPHRARRFHSVAPAYRSETRRKLAWFPPKSRSPHQPVTQLLQSCSSECAR